MKGADRRHERLVTAAVAAPFAAFWVIVFALGEPPEFPSKYATSAILVAGIATPWVIAARLLWRDWWARSGARLSTVDGPARLLAAAVATLPGERRDWGAAMAAELGRVQGSSERWRFAAGCARAAIFPPRASRVPVLVVAALSAGALAAAEIGLGHTLPGMRFFGVLFVALVGAMATLAAARSRGVLATAPGPTLAGAGVLGVAACIAATANFLVENPAAGEHLAPSAAAVLAAVLAGCLWLALTPPRGLTTERLSRGLGVVAGLALGLGCVFTSRLSIHTNGGPVVWVILAPAVIFFAASAVAASVGRSFRAGVQAAVWTGVVGALLVFAVWLPEALHRYGVDARLLLDGERGHSIGENLDDAVWVLVAVPILGLPFGVIGAAAARRWRGAPPSGTNLPENARC
ncbi:MAG: hypothetical protein L0323_11560 [Planctomycetes bacterium]|nr:hypothetical protein [Planctomycetota bacterium]